eukprot:7949669-Pyramimonas_sp.AAC.1
MPRAGSMLRDNAPTAMTSTGATSQAFGWTGRVGVLMLYQRIDPGCRRWTLEGARRSPFGYYLCPYGPVRG